ncbi:hypothetical protein C8Q78DRAFT_1015181 [Trametes maxima]|nr:hypothetical protein C8Q78DRAFT_1015181 [Trametes maxima]
MTLAQACFRAPGSIPAAILNDLSPELRGSFLKRGMLVDVLIVCCLVLFCRVTLGTAQAAFYIWYSGALAMDAQRSAESSWSLYSTGSSAKSFAALRWGVSSLLESSLARVSRTLQILRLGPSALVDTLVTPSSQRPKEAHRGRRGGKREQRRRRTQVSFTFRSARMVLIVVLPPYSYSHYRNIMRGSRPPLVLLLPAHPLWRILPKIHQLSETVRLMLYLVRRLPLTAAVASFVPSAPTVPSWSIRLPPSRP